MTRAPRILLGLIALVCVSAAPGFSQTGDDIRRLQEQIDALKAEQRGLQRELQELKALLRGRAGEGDAREVVLSVGEAPAKGARTATVTLVEFSDYQCPFCSQYARETLPQIERDYVATGKVRYVLRNFPIDSLHPQAFKAHEAAHCAGDQGKYWEMHHRLFANQQGLGDLAAHAGALGIDEGQFRQCLESGRHASRVRKDQSDGLAAGVRGTPTFFLGFTAPGDSTVKVVRAIVGAQPYQAFKEAIEGLLSSTAR